MSSRNALRRLRSEVGLTQVEMAERLNIGFVTLNRWENGRTFPNRANAKNIIRTARDMGVTQGCIDYLTEALSPSRMRDRHAAELGFPALDQGLLCRMVDGSSVGVVLIDEETKKILYVNRRAEEIIGRKFFEVSDDHCWSYLKGFACHCDPCDPARYPLDGYRDMSETSPEGLKLKNRTRSIIWKGRKIYVVYILDESELDRARSEVSRLSSLPPSGAGVFYAYEDGRLEAADAYCSLSGDGSLNPPRAGIPGASRIETEDVTALKNEICSSIAAGRDIDLEFHRGDAPMRFRARQFAKDDEKRMFLYSLTDAAGKDDK